MFLAHLVVETHEQNVCILLFRYTDIQDEVIDTHSHSGVAVVG